MLRFLKIIAPVKCVIPLYDGYIVPPKEGELHRKFTSWKAIYLNLPAPWSYNIDKLEGGTTRIRNVRGLQLLWDTVA